MLVCNVSLRPPRTAIAADIAEITTALDNLGSGSGQVVFATLVDDPASVGETVDAYLGEIMLEAASASDAFSVVNVYDAAVSETVTASDTQSAAMGITSVTWDAATVANVTLSGGNLVATNTGTTSADQGARVADAFGKTSGKHYFEVTLTTLTAGGINRGVGIGTTTSTYTGMGNTGGVTGVEAYLTNTVWSMGSSILTFSGGGWIAGQVMGVAVDLDNRRIWFRSAPSGNWNDNASNNPATNVGGLTIPAGTMVPFCTFGGSSGTSGNVVTANFGASAFTGTVPSGFTSGWPV